MVSSLPLSEVLKHGHFTGGSSAGQNAPGEALVWIPAIRRFGSRDWVSVIVTDHGRFGGAGQHALVHTDLPIAFHAGPRVHRVCGEELVLP